MNYIDLIIIAILLYHMIRGYYLGFWPLFARLISFFIAIYGATLLYKSVGDLIHQYFISVGAFAYGIGYLFSFFIIQLIINLLINKLFFLIPLHIRQHKISKIAGIIPGFLDGAIFIAMILLVLLISPTPASIRDDISSSKIASYTTDKLKDVQNTTNKIFGGSIDNALSLLTTKSEGEGTISIPYHPSKLSVDEAAEIKMLRLVNEERAKVGAPALVKDQTIVPVARAHSRDMWVRGYFSHENPDGKDPFDRMKAGGVKFIYAGENIALAPNVDVSHKGLMNSPGHKRNILDPNFRRVGIGIIDGGIYGQMYTQDFAD